MQLAPSVFCCAAVPPHSSFSPSLHLHAALRPQQGLPCKSDGSTMQVLRRGRGLLQAAAAELDSMCTNAMGAQLHTSAARDAEAGEPAKPLQRFYKSANVAPAPQVMVMRLHACKDGIASHGLCHKQVQPDKMSHSAIDQGGYQVTLDSRTLKSPAGKPLVLPSRLLALAVAAEWEQQASACSAHFQPQCQDPRYVERLSNICLSPCL